MVYDAEPGRLYNITSLEILMKFACKGVVNIHIVTPRVDFKLNLGLHACIIWPAAQNTSNNNLVLFNASKTLASF